MMWLLYTPRAELHEFQAGPEAVPGGFAILSHRWQKEQSFKELQALSEECKRTGANPRDRAHWKIRRFCECAESWGHKWAWADMCCIDKSSSSELSEAINSMYRYYSLAEVCYAYLEDVPAKGWSVPVDPSSGTAGPAGTSVHFSPFGRSEWHKRGWTLQELIAPRTVIFLSQEWMTLGAKADHAGLLNQCTGIPESILTLSRRPAHFSIAQRMSWAARRTTTRLEDEAYCLMGIFDVNMPTLYGEGRRAFRRLQEEIMRRSVDPSLFAWGLQSPLDQVSEVSSESTPCPWDHSSSAHLFAESPDDFTHSREVSFDRPQHFDGEKWLRLGIHVNAGHRKVPTFTNTPFGVLASLLILRISGDLYGMLLGRDVAFDPVVLELKKCLSAQDAPGDVYHPVRRRRLRATDVAGSDDVDIYWQNIYISTDPSSEQNHIGPILPQVSLIAPFHISYPHLLSDEMNVDVSRLHHPWTGNPPLKISVRSPGINAYLCFEVHLGCCITRLESDGSMARWAYVDSGEVKDPPDDQESSSITHDCPGHHIDEWHNRTRIFHGVYRFFEWGGFWDDVEISFTESCLPVPLGCVKPLQPQLKIIYVSLHPPMDDSNKSMESRLSAALHFGAGVVLPGGPALVEPAPPSLPVHPLGTTGRVDNHDCDSEPSEESKNRLSTRSGHSRRRRRTGSDDDDFEYEQHTASRVHGTAEACAEASLAFPASSRARNPPSTTVPLAGISGLVYPQRHPSTSNPGRAAKKRPRRQ